EEAVISYTLYLKEIDEGRSANVPAPAIARQYWKLADDATLRDVVLVVRADEAHHRDVNHGFADELAGLATVTAKAPYPEHASEIRLAA
ncbi:MAG: alternative oxidase, partial [Croceibacterium sp.]